MVTRKAKRKTTRSKAKGKGAFARSPMMQEAKKVMRAVVVGAAAGAAVGALKGAVDAAGRRVDFRGNEVASGSSPNGRSGRLGSRLKAKAGSKGKSTRRA